MCKYVHAVDQSSIFSVFVAQAGLLRVYSDLAGHRAFSGGLSEESHREQKSAGLLTADPDQRKLVQDYNAKYKDKFGFPFVICTKLNSVDTIVVAMSTRLNNNHETEIRNGIEELKIISYLRLCNIVDVKAQANLWKPG